MMAARYTLPFFLSLVALHLCIGSKAHDSKPSYIRKIAAEPREKNNVAQRSYRTYASSKPDPRAFQPAEFDAALDFLKQHMPASDKGNISDENLQRDVRLAMQARYGSHWASSVPAHLFHNDVLPYANLDEPRDSWRPLFHR